MKYTGNRLKFLAGIPAVQLLETVNDATRRKDYWYLKGLWRDIRYFMQYNIELPRHGKHDFFFKNYWDSIRYTQTKARALFKLVFDPRGKGDDKVLQCNNAQEYAIMVSRSDNRIHKTYRGFRPHGQNKIAESNLVYA